MRISVITTINPPDNLSHGVGLKNFSIVIGDAKTPQNWEEQAGEQLTFISLKEQYKQFPKLSQLLPENHYSRKNIGYIMALRNGATEIYDTDDDNTIIAGTTFPSFSGRYNNIVSTTTASCFFNIYSLYTDKKIWARGFPLDQINNPVSVQITQQSSNLAIWQGLVNVDPDIDAIYRLTRELPFSFEKQGEFVLEEKVVCPFNSQNTLIQAHYALLAYIPCSVSFRFCDILRSYIATPILWEAGARVGFCGPNAIQYRNPHSIFKDFLDEIPMYRHAKESFLIAQDCVKPNVSIADNLFNVYHGLISNKIVQSSELQCLESYINAMCDFL